MVKRRVEDSAGDLGRALSPRGGDGNGIHYLIETLAILGFRPAIGRGEHG